MSLIVNPEDWYRLYWIVWAIAVIALARWVLVEPIIRAIRESK